jgi:hypothetical protein
MSVFTVFSVVKVGSKIGNLSAEDVEMAKQVQGETVDGAMFNLSVSNGAVLIYATVLVVLRVVCQRSKDLKTRALVI